MAKPTREDAQLLLQAAQWGTSIGLGDAMGALFSEDFDPESAEFTDEAVRTALVFGESLGTLVKHDLLSRESWRTGCGSAGSGTASARPPARRVSASASSASTRTSKRSPRAS